MAHKGIAVVTTLILLLSAHFATAGTIQLPQTGQAACYDTTGTVIDCASTGQDGMHRKGVLWPVPRFTIIYCDATGPCQSQVSDCDADKATDIVTDNLTGLVWARDTGYTQRTWQDSLTYVNSLELCGQNDWRLPNVNELLSLRNEGVGRTDWWLQDQGFSGAPFGDYQTSTAYALDPANLWYVNIGYGYIGSTARISLQYTFPVRGPDTLGPAPVWKTGQMSCYNDSGTSTGCPGTGQDGEYHAGVAWPTPRFTVGTGAKADCITDELTGLMWVKTPNDSLRDWQGGLTYANDLTLCGYDDWRMPNVIEQRSLFNYEGRSDDWLNTQGFIAVPSGRFSTSTTSVEYTTYAMFEDIYDGRIMSYFEKDPSNTYYAWAVRAGGGSFGTIGTQLTITGSDFGTKKGKVLIGDIAAKIAKNGWSPTQIICTINKPPLPVDVANPVAVVVNRVPIPFNDTFTLKNPVLDDLSVISGTSPDPIKVTGMFFGTKKGKVYLYDQVNKKKKNLRVTSWDMIASTGASTLTFQVPKPSKSFPAGPYPLKVTNKIGSATASTEFTIE